ncbi:hypothetical protein [Flavobacterium sp.]|uniref:hypothetical protein n=1 Tax=Flavobacterium sp. TaxID=239 RepID=UPI002636D6F4|nr:hypothetical protein [Flavobacterium sp.]
MKFFCLRNSTEKKIVGQFPPVITALYNCDVWNEKRFTQQINFEKFDFDPIIATPVLRKGAKKIDFINASIVGFQFKPIISEKLFKIFAQLEGINFKFFACGLSHKEVIYDYYVMIPTSANMEYVDFPKSIVIEKKISSSGEAAVKNLSFNSFEDFLAAKKSDVKNDILISNLTIKPEVDTDLFVIRYAQGGAKFIASERLKEEIEKNSITGIEFQPLTYSFSEWLNSEERLKIYGK